MLKELSQPANKRSDRETVPKRKSTPKTKKNPADSV